MVDPGFQASSRDLIAGSISHRFDKMRAPEMGTAVKPR
jgi:hypothetical protein